MQNGFFPSVWQKKPKSKKKWNMWATWLSSWDGSTQLPKETCHYIYHTYSFGPKSPSERASIFTVRTSGNQSINSHGYFPTGLMGNIFALENLPGLSQGLQHLCTTGHSLSNRRDEHAPFGPCHPTNKCSYWLHL